MSLNTSTSDVPSLTRTGASEPGATSSILRPRDLGHMRLQRNKKGPRSTPKHTRNALAFGHARPTQVSVGSFSHEGLNMGKILSIWIISVTRNSQLITTLAATGGHIPRFRPYFDNPGR